MFIGRQKELQFLHERLTSNRFEMIPIYGRRRVGKTRLLEEFIKDKKSIFFTANQLGEKVNLRRLSEAINALVSPNKINNEYVDFQSAFETVGSYAANLNEPLVFIMDEYPYLALGNEGISSVLQFVIDKQYLNLPNLTLILTGSHLSFMETQVLGYESPLYGRRTGQMKILPFTFKESKQMLPKFAEEDMLTLHGLTGGIPLYLTMVDDEKSLKENIIKEFLASNTFLYEEPQNLLLQEIRNPRKYNDILYAIANGATELSRIMDMTQLTSSLASNHLSTLIDLHIVDKVTPLSKIGKRKPIYKIKDGLFHFWYRYVPRYQRFIETSRIELVWDKIELDLIQFTSLVFEDLCRAWILTQDELLMEDVGAWWGNNPLVKNNNAQAEEVDVIGISLNKDEIVIGECKWRNERTGVEVGKQLLEKSKFFPYTKKRLYIFSKSEFTEELQDLAHEYNIQLVRFKDMLI